MGKNAIVNENKTPNENGHTSKKKTLSGNEDQNESARAQKINELESEILELEVRIQEHYGIMGRALLDFAHDGQAESDNLVDQLIAARKELSFLKEEIRCPLCETTNPAMNKYCRACGSRLNPEERGVSDEK